MLTVVPIKFKAACEFISQHHRHHKPPQGWMFGCGIAEDGRLCGVAMVGRPVARRLDDGLTVEVTRLCTDGTKNAASALYAACWRAARALGYLRLGTYILASEPGTTLKAAGWQELYWVKGRSWTCPSRPRNDGHPLDDKLYWQKASSPCLA
jgi:hypothetical protein